MPLARPRIALFIREPLVSPWHVRYGLKLQELRVQSKSLSGRKNPM